MYINIINNKIVEITDEQLDNYIYVPDDLTIGLDWTIGSWDGDRPSSFISPQVPMTEEEIQQANYNHLSNEIRQRRDYLLQETDWIVIKAVDTNTEIPNEYQIYRQSLRDITQHPNFPNLQEEDWPIKPN